jgi:hypothetical protein
MDEERKKGLMEEFKKAEGSQRLDMWDYACSQQVLWEKILDEMQKIANEQGIDKKLDKLIEEEMKRAEEEAATI